ncbi:ead/Ea22-like family protein [Escherichia coli]|uniref:ead/Ea22-like family protein n=1 Tax=Escherichia coli TaxID=562 RepID=UPI003CFDFE02
MSNINYQVLREAAENAKNLGGIKNYKRGEQAVAEFKSLITPHIVLALLEEREGNQQYIKRRDQENEDIALTVGKLRVELEAAKKRIAELKAEPVSQTYKLNQLSGNSPVTPDSWISCSERMPDKLIPVMVMYEDGEMWSAMWNGNRWDDGTEYPDPHSVTHWREMPAAPQQEVK